ncbi:MAG: phenylalanine--tRNA ligase subunit beta [Bacteroidales bacterium]
MNISYSWLKQYIDINLSPAEVARVLTGIGLEVEAVESVEKIKGGLRGFVIGEVKTCEKHPDADKLSVTTVDTGEENLLNIVCGAPNVAAGQRVVVATIGTTVYKGDESFQIKKAKIRGVVSEGMICAEDEIGLGTSHDGIMVLPGDAPVGMPAETFFKVEAETMFVIGLTPNRIDSASHFGVARDLAAYLKKDRDVALIKPDVSAFITDHRNFPVEVVIENAKSCPRYAGVSVSGVKVGPSPQWLQDRLLAIGMNPINNIVDITNFVLHELGQPLHAFDADEIRGGRIVVKNMPEGTPFVTLDNVERKLSKDDLMICDGAGPVAIGGVFGGLHSGVTDKTSNIFIESAYFDPVSVRLTSKRHGLNTDASFRFERGVDPAGTLVALKRCALLVKEIAGGEIASDIVDIYPQPLQPVQVKVSFAHIDRLIGKKIDRPLIRSILISLDFQILSEDEAGFELLVPQYRVDVTREADVIEEILRIYGYNNVEISNKLNTSLSFSNRPDNEKLVDMISEFLTGCGFTEIMNNSLTRSAYYDQLISCAPENLVKIINPLSNDLNVMRQTLLFGGLETIQHNTNRQRPDLRLFEAGNVYSFHSEKGKRNPLDKYHEEYHLALFVTGKKHEPNWVSDGKSSGFYDLKAHLENVLKRMGLHVDMMEKKALAGNNDLFTDGLVYRTGGVDIAELALVKAAVLKKFDIKNDVFYAVIRWQNLVKCRGDHQVRYTELPRFPEVRRDLALLLDKSLTFDKIKELAFRIESKLLTRVDLFDVYEGEQVGAGKKSYAVSFILQDLQATLTDEKIDRTMKRLMEAYVKELGAVIR